MREPPPKLSAWDIAADEGFEAFVAGMSVLDNPEKPMTEQFYAWQDGWFMAAAYHGK